MADYIATSPPAEPDALSEYLSRELIRIEEALSDPLQAPSYTVATLPSALTPGRIIFVSDESGGAVLAFSDGTNWRRSTDRAIVS